MTDQFTYRKLPPIILCSLLLGACSSSDEGYSPTVDAGTNQSVIEFDNVDLLGSANDPDGQIVSYQWSQTAGTEVTIENADSVNASFVAPDIAVDETLSFQLTVRDNHDNTASASVDVSVAHINAIPTVHAGADQTVVEQNTVTLNGEGDDTDGSIASYQWLQTSGPTVTLDNANSGVATFEAPDVVLDQALSFELTVTDNEGDSATDSVDVLITHINALPTVSAGMDKTVTEQVTVNLYGSAEDVDGSTINLQWTQLQGTNVTLNGAEQSNVIFTAPKVDSRETLVFQLDATDDSGATSSDDVSIDVIPNKYAKWQYSTEGPIHSAVTIGADGTIYSGSDDNHLHAINPDGSRKWAFETGYWIYSKPAVAADGTVYVGSWDNNLYAVNPDGSQKWAFTTGQAVMSEPVIAQDGTIYLTSFDKNVYALHPDGNLKWSYTLDDVGQHAPALGPDGTLYISSWDHKLYAINPEGSLQWSFITGGVINSQPVVASDGTVYVGSDDNNLYAIQPNGLQKWRYATNDSVQSPHLAEDGSIYVASLDHNLYALNADGSLKWSFGGNFMSPPNVSQDGTVYIANGAGQLLAIDNEGKGLWAFKAGDVTRSKVAIAADGTLYFASNDGNVYAIDGKGKK